MRKITKMFCKAKQKNTPALYIQNVRVGIQTLENIKRWENQKNDLIIRSSFNRELYYKYLEVINY